MNWRSESNLHVCFVKHRIVLFKEIQSKYPIVPRASWTNLNSASGSRHTHVAWFRDLIVISIDVVCQVREIFIVLICTKAWNKCHASITQEANMCLTQEIVNFHEISRWHDKVWCAAVYNDLFMWHWHIRITELESIEFHRPIIWRIWIMPVKPTFCIFL